MSSTLTSVADMEPLEAISLSKPTSAVDDHPDDNPAAKGGQDASHWDSWKDGSTPEDRSTEISPTNTQYTSQPQANNNEITLVAPASQAATKPKELLAAESVAEYRPTLTREDVDFVSGMLFFRQVLESQGSGNQEMKLLASRVSNFLKLGPPQADSNDDPQITTAAELKNQSALTTSSSPASTKKDISSLRSSDTTEKPSKSTQPGAGACKPSGEEGWKRGLSGKRKTIVLLDSEDEGDEIEIIPPLPIPPQSDSSQDLVTTADDSARPIKRPRLTKGNNAIPAAARPSPPEESHKASSDEEPKGRRTSRSRAKVTASEFRDYINTEATWLNIASLRCSNIRKVFTKQKRLLESLDALEKESCHIVAEISAKQKVSREARLRLGGELESVEERRCKVISELRTAMISGSTEGGEMKQNLEKWRVKESKVTDRIEKSR